MSLNRFDLLDALFLHLGPQTLILLNIQLLLLVELPEPAPAAPVGSRGLVQVLTSDFVLFSNIKVFARRLEVLVEQRAVLFYAHALSLILLPSLSIF